MGSIIDTDRRRNFICSQQIFEYLRYFDVSIFPLFEHGFNYREHEEHCMPHIKQQDGCFAYRHSLATFGCVAQIQLEVPVSPFACFC